MKQPDAAAFVRAIFNDGERGRCGGGATQDLGVETGVLVPVPVTEPCGEGCACEWYSNFPGTCYRVHPDLALRALLTTTEEAQLRYAEAEWEGWRDWLVTLPAPETGTAAPEALPVNENPVEWPDWRHARGVGQTTSKISPEEAIRAVRDA